MTTLNVWGHRLMERTRHTAPSAPAWMVAVSLFIMVLLGVWRPHMQPVAVDADPGVPAESPGETPRAEPPPLPPEPAAPEMSAFERRVRELESVHCPEMLPRDGLPDPMQRVDVETTTVSPGLAFALITTPCHDSGAYNYHYSVYVQKDGDVRLADFAPAPSWARDAAATYRRPFARAGAEGIWNASITSSDHGVMLSSVMLARGLGDSGDGFLHTWTGERFELYAVRARDGGDFGPENAQPFPIVAPPARRCSGELAISRSNGTATLTSWVGVASRVASFPVAESDCAAGRDTITCGTERFNPIAEFALIAEGDDWVVMRISRDDEHEVLRVRRGCALAPPL